ncbi:MAG: hypothetical protein QXO55_07910 [Candidatus Korarchaeum sp.]
MSRTVGARIPLDLYERIMRVSEERGISASDLIKEAATLYLRLLEMAEERGTTVEKLVNAIEKPSESVDYLRGRLDTLERFLMVLLSSKVSLAEARELALLLTPELSIRVGIEIRSPMHSVDPRDMLRSLDSALLDRYTFSPSHSEITFTAPYDRYNVHRPHAQKRDPGVGSD